MQGPHGRHPLALSPQVEPPGAPGGQFLPAATGAAAAPEGAAVPTPTHDLRGETPDLLAEVAHLCMDRRLDLLGRPRGVQCPLGDRHSLTQVHPDGPAVRPTAVLQFAGGLPQLGLELVRIGLGRRDGLPAVQVELQGVQPLPGGGQLAAEDSRGRGVDGGSRVHGIPPFFMNGTRRWLYLVSVCAHRLNQEPSGWAPGIPSQDGGSRTHTSSLMRGAHHLIQQRHVFAIGSVEPHPA